MNAVCLDQVCFRYAAHTVFENLSISFPKKCIIGLTGPNGSGKSTLFHLISNLLKPQAGTIHLFDQPTEHLTPLQTARLVSVVPQLMLGTPSFRVQDFVQLGQIGPTTQDSLEHILEQTHLMHLRNVLLHNLSGGERQRAIIAQTLAQNTPLILLDEPFSFLDMEEQERLAELLQQLCHNQGKTLLLISHNRHWLSQLCNPVYCIKNGIIAINYL